MKRNDKPRIFLSHSSGDKEFINSLNRDLKRCGIDTWLDAEAIRPGQAWLSAIFQDGLPSCDAVFVYLTDNSVDSAMVEKEIDSAILLFSEKKIRFLPYVCSDEVRNRLRADLRTLHCQVLNQQNYSEQLPVIVSEIWKCHFDNVVGKSQIYSVDNQKLIVRNLLTDAYTASDGSVSIYSQIDIDRRGNSKIYREYNLSLKSPMFCHSYDIFIDKPGLIDIRNVVDLLKKRNLNYLVLEQTDVSLLCYVLFKEIVNSGNNAKFAIDATAENYMSDLVDKGIGRWAFKNRPNPKTKGFVQKFTFPKNSKFSNLTATILLCGRKNLIGKTVLPIEEEGRLVMSFDLTVDKGFSDDVLIEFQCV